MRMRPPPRDTADGALLAQAGLDEQSRRRRLAFLQFGPEDEAILAEIRSFAREHVDEIVDAFYAHLLTFEETRRRLGDESQIARLKKLQRAYFLRMTEGRLDAEYFESRLRVGAAHARIDLEPQWYLGTYNTYLRLVTDRLRQHYTGDPERLGAVLDALTKVIFLDMGLAIDAYILGGYVDRALAQEYRRVADVAERTLREKEELERVKADLTGMIVHDLKGPLAGILTVARLALRKREDLGPRHAEQFEQIARSARDLMRMTENLLEIDQMEEGRLELRVEAVDVAALVGECADEFRAATELAGQTLETGVADHLPAIVTDRWLLRRVLTNLLVNAIRHGGTGSRIDLTADTDRHQIRFEVRDTGRGIPPEILAKLFTKSGRFARRAHRDDAGLGLVFCKMAVETMGGTIAVDSAPGAGATFTIRLPANAER